MGFTGMDNNYCCVPQCRSHGVHLPRPSFHRFPSVNERNGIRRLQWIAKLRIGKEVTDRMVVCGKHFKESDFFPATAGVNGLKRRVLKRNAIPSRNLPTTPECDDKTKDNVKLKKIKRSMSDDKILVNKRMPPAERKLLYLGETSSYESIRYQEKNETSSSYLDEIPEKNTVTSPFITRLSVMTPNNSTVNAITPEQNSEDLEKCSQNFRQPLLPVKYKDNSELHCLEYNSSPDDSAVNASTSEQNSEDVEKFSQNFRQPLLPVKYKENSELDCLEYNSSPDDSSVNANTSEQNSEDVEKHSQNFRQPLLPVKYKENSELDCSKYNSSPDDSKETLTQKLEAMISINAKLQKKIKFYQGRCQMYEKEVNIMKGVIDSLKQINSVTFDC